MDQGEGEVVAANEPGNIKPSGYIVGGNLAAFKFNVKEIMRILISTKLYLHNQWEILTRSKISARVQPCNC